MLMPVHRVHVRNDDVKWALLQHRMRTQAWQLMMATGLRVFPGRRRELACCRLLKRSISRIRAIYAAAYYHDNNVDDDIDVDIDIATRFTAVCTISLGPVATTCAQNSVWTSMIT